jgi:hypothetical protein
VLKRGLKNIPGKSRRICSFLSPIPKSFPSPVTKQKITWENVCGSIKLVETGTEIQTQNHVGRDHKLQDRGAMLRKCQYETASGAWDPPGVQWGTDWEWAQPE